MRIHVGIALTTEPERTRGLLEEFCRALSDASGVEVIAHGMWQYHHLLEALAADRVQLCWLPPILALRATGQGRIVPLALPVRHGVSTYSSALFTRPDSKVRGLDDLVGLRAAWVDPQSAAGYLIIRALLRSKGVDLARAFADNRFYGAHDAVARAVCDGEADVGATFVYLDPDSSSGAAFPKSAGWGDDAVHMVACASSIPSDLIAANVTLPDAIQDVVRTALCSATSADLQHAARRLLGAEGFVPPVQEHLESLVAILRGLDEPADRPYTLFPPRRPK